MTTTVADDHEREPMSWLVSHRMSIPRDGSAPRGPAADVAPVTPMA